MSRLFNAPATRPPMTEKELQANVIELAHLLGWRCAHFRPAKTSYGWRTPIQGDGAGFPDCVLIHPKHGILWRELKASRGRVRVEQKGWLEWLADVGADVRIWTPADWHDGLILTELRGHA